MTGDKTGVGFGDLINPDNIFTKAYIEKTSLQSDRAFLNPKGSGAVVGGLKRMRAGLRRGVKQLNADQFE